MRAMPKPYPIMHTSPACGTVYGTVRGQGARGRVYGLGFRPKQSRRWARAKVATAGNPAATA